MFGDIFAELAQQEIIEIELKRYRDRFQEPIRRFSLSEQAVPDAGERVRDS